MLRAVTFELDIDDKSSVQVTGSLWSVSAETVGSSADLDEVLPVLVAAVKPFIGKRVEGSVVEKMNGIDRKIMELREGRQLASSLNASGPLLTKVQRRLKIGGYYVFGDLIALAQRPEFTHPDRLVVSVRRPKASNEILRRPDAWLLSSCGNSATAFCANSRRVGFV